MILTQENHMKFHIQYRIQAKEEIELIKLGVFYKILLGDTPDFTWVPHLRPQKAFVIGDHVFRSPVLLYMKGKYAIGMIPDLNLLSKYRMIPTYLDFNLRNTEFEPFPILSYAFGQYTPDQHLYFKLQRKTPWILAKNSSLILGYHLLFTHTYPPPNY